MTFNLHPDDPALYDLAMGQVVEPGGLIVFVGGSSTEALEGHFQVPGETLVLAPTPPRRR